MAADAVTSWIDGITVPAVVTSNVPKITDCCPTPTPAVCWLAGNAFVTAVDPFNAAATAVKPSTPIAVISNTAKAAVPATKENAELPLVADIADRLY
jgi:hypothetical protein